MALIQLLGSVEPTNNSIFKEDSQDGYFTKSEFANTPKEWASNPKTQFKLRNLIDVFTIMQAKIPLTGMPNHTFNNGERGTWLSFRTGKVRRSLFLHHFGDMERFIDDYASGNLQIDKSLDDYYKEAYGE